MVEKLVDIYLRGLVLRHDIVHVIKIMRDNWQLAAMQAHDSSCTFLGLCV